VHTGVILDTRVHGRLSTARVNTTRVDRYCTPGVQTLQTQCCNLYISWRRRRRRREFTSAGRGLYARLI